MHTVILGTGSYVPERVVTNDELAPRLGTTSEWIEERTGIHARHYVADGEATSDLGAKAARRALDDADLDVSDIDAIVFATLSPDAAFPGSGVFMQRELGLSDIPALDVRNQCSGFLYGLSVTDAWLRSGVYEHVLLVGAEVHSTGLDFSPEGRDVTVLFGDGGGAFVLGRGEEAGVMSVELGADGSGAELLWCEIPGSGLTPSMAVDHLEEGRQYPKMKGRAVFRRAVEVLEAEVGEVLEDLHHEHGVAKEDVLFVPHQANRRITEMIAERLDLDDRQCVHTIDRYANTTAASIPMAFDTARRDGRITPGQLVLVAAFGSGFTWGTAVIRM